MDQQTISRIFQQTAYVRTGGSAEEKQAAIYLQEECKKFGCAASLEAFSVDMATIETAKLTADDKQIPCKGYLCAGNGCVEAPLYY